MNILKLLMPRSKLHWLKKYMLILIISAVPITAIYFSSSTITKYLHQKYHQFYKKSSDTLINLGFKADNIIIHGHNIVQETRIRNSINTQNSLLLISISDLKNKLLKENCWIKTIIIKRMLPNTLELKIEEYKPFLNHHHGNIVSVIDDTGYVIIENFKLDNIVSVYGKIKKKDLSFIKKILEINDELRKLISSFTRVNERRWNVTLSSGLEIKLPEIDPYNSWDYILHLHNESKSFLNWKVIDMRIATKIFIKK